MCLCVFVYKCAFAMICSRTSLSVVRAECAQQMFIIGLCNCVLCFCNLLFCVSLSLFPCPKIASSNQNYWPNISTYIHSQKVSGGFRLGESPREALGGGRGRRPGGLAKVKIRELWSSESSSSASMTTRRTRQKWEHVIWNHKNLTISIIIVQCPCKHLQSNKYCRYWNTY